MCSCVEVVETLLPAAVAFYANFDTSENDLFATLEIYTKLDNISIVDGYGRLSTPGLDRRTWLRKVPELDLTSLTYHCPLAHQNSQWRRETTFDLKPTGREFSSAVGVSRSLYRPTRTMVLGFLSVLETAWKCREGLEERVSTCGMKRIVGCASFAGGALDDGAPASADIPAAKGVTAVAALALVMLTGLSLVSRCTGCVSVLVRSMACLLSPLRPWTVGTQPPSRLCIPDCEPDLGVSAFELLDPAG